MSIHSTSNEVKATIDQIDKNTEKMAEVLIDEIHTLDRSFRMYLHRIQKTQKNCSPALYDKLENAKIIFEQVQREAREIAEMQDPLTNIREVNKMIRFALQNFEGQGLVKVSSYIGAIANICLGQLKYIKSRYESILKLIRSEILGLWMDREVSSALQLILSVNNLRLNKFLSIFHLTEVLYADISLTSNQEKEELQERIVLRMVSNRFHSDEERKIINTLFPYWDIAKN